MIQSFNGLIRSAAPPWDRLQPCAPVAAAGVYPDKVGDHQLRIWRDKPAATTGRCVSRHSSLITRHCVTRISAPPWDRLRPCAPVAAAGVYPDKVGDRHFETWRGPAPHGTGRDTPAAAEYLPFSFSIAQSPITQSAMAAQSRQSPPLPNQERFFSWRRGTDINIRGTRLQPRRITPQPNVGFSR